MSILCLCYVIMTLAAPFPAGAAAPDYELSVLYAQTFPADTTAYDSSAPSTASDDSNDLPILSDAAAAKPGEIIVLTLGFRNNTASAVQIGAFNAKLSYEQTALETCNLFGDNAYQMSEPFAAWIGLPVVKENYVNVNAMSTQTYAAAANSQTELARLAFRVKSGAAEGVISFTFDAKTSVTAGNGKKLTLGDFAPFTLSVGGGSNPTPTPPDSGDSGDSATPAPDPAPESKGGYDVSVLYAQTFPADTTAYDALAEACDSAQPGEIIVLTLGFRNNAASPVQIGAFNARLSYDQTALEACNLFDGNAYQMSEPFAAWMGLPVVKENYVNVNAMSTQTYAAAANSQTELARLAFRVKSGAADGVISFTFDSKTSVTVGNGKKLTLGAFTPFTLAVGGNAPAHEYAIGKLTRNGGEISAEITNQSGAGGVLTIAAYSDTGKFLRCATETVTESRIAQGSAGNVAVTLDVSGAKTIRAFLLDAETLRPLSGICSESV